MAQGNLMVTPRRVIFEGQRNIQELNLANTGKDTARYLISMLEIRMKQDGTFEQITVPDSGQNFASRHIRFFPRSVTLGPGEVQTVKVQVTRQSQLKTGEYRSHIYFRAVPEAKPLGAKEPVEEKAGLSVQLTPVFGITIPVIIRSGESSATVHLSQAGFNTLPNGKPVVNMVLERTGDRSVYGDLTVDFISSQGKKIRVGIIKGIAVYTPTPSRKLLIALDRTDGVDYNNGKLHIVYTTPLDDKPVKLAETEVELNTERKPLNAKR